MVVISVDSSGHVGQPPIWFVAVRKNSKIQKHYCIYISKADQDKYKDGKHWKERLSAVLIFDAIQHLIHDNDSIEIDKDFQGKTMDLVYNYLKKLFGKLYFGRKLSNPNIQFHTKKMSIHVKEAHIKSQKARHGEIQKNFPNNIDRLMNIIT